MKNLGLLSLLFIWVLMVEVAAVAGQTPGTSPVPKSPPAAPAGETQEPLKVFTEEVIIPIFVLDGNRRFDPTLEVEDLLVFEDDVLQEIRSVRREPSSVLLLLDTAGEKPGHEDKHYPRDRQPADFQLALGRSCGSNSVRRSCGDNS